MAYPTTNNIGVVNNPITTSVYSNNNHNGIVAPGNPLIIDTENFLKITTEDGKYLITET